MSSNPNDGGPRDVIGVFERFRSAWNSHVSLHKTETSPVDIFYAGYKAGYGHAKDDAVGNKPADPNNPLWDEHREEET